MEFRGFLQCFIDIPAQIVITNGACSGASSLTTSGSARSSACSTPSDLAAHLLNCARRLSARCPCTLRTRAFEHRSAPRDPKGRQLPLNRTSPPAQSHICPSDCAIESSAIVTGFDSLVLGLDTTLQAFDPVDVLSWIHRSATDRVLNEVIGSATTRPMVWRH